MAPWRFLLVSAAAIFSSAAFAYGSELCSEVVPLYRSHNDSDTFWTRHKYEADLGGTWFGFRNITLFARIAIRDNVTGCNALLKPLYRTYNFEVRDHFYTCKEKLLRKASRKLGYLFQGIVGYVPENENDCPGTIPIHRFNLNDTHLYTFDMKDGDLWMAFGGMYEGIDGYLWPA